MLSKLFRSTPKWQSIKSQKRIEAIRELQPGQDGDLDILTRLAREDSEPAVRREAVQKLHDFDILMQIQKRDLEAVVREAAGARLHELMAGKSPFSPPLEERLQRLERIKSPQVLAALIRDAEPVDVRLAAIAALQDEMYLQDIALHSTVARLRQAAAERIGTPALLEELAHASRQKDKTVYRIAKGRLDELHNREKAEKERQERAIALCESMEAHARSSLNPLYAAKTESLRQQWNELATNHSLSVAERFATAHALACRQIAEVEAVEQRAADEVQARHELQGALETLESTIKEFDGQDGFDLPALSAVRKTQRLRWELASQLQPPAPAVARRYESAMQSLDSLEALLGQWSQDRPLAEAACQSLAAGNDDVDAAREALRVMINHYLNTGWSLPVLLRQAATLVDERPAPVGKMSPTEAAAELGHSLQQQLDGVESSLRTGNSREASRRWKQVVDFARRHHLQHPRMQMVGEQVRELKSWVGFVVQPKKEALLAAMQALITQDIDPDDKADRIKILQGEWKSLGVADPAIEQPLWEQFKVASDAAFEPCRQYFAGQRELRALNLKKRITLCEQLEQYHLEMPESIDWKKHDVILKTARQEWQQYQPVDRQSSRHVHDRFNTIIKTLEARREEHWQRVAQSKQALVEKAHQLLNADDLRSACDQAKLLQQEWTLIGSGSARADGKQWKEFRAACDAIFSRREEAFKARKATRDGLIQRAELLVQAMEALAASPTEASRPELARLNTELRELDIGRDGNVLRERAQKASRAFESFCHEQRHQQASRQIRAGIDAWVAVCAAEQALMDNALPLQPDVSGLPALWKSALSGRQQAAIALNGATEKIAEWQDSVASNTQAVLDALMDLELALDLPSPPSREQERRRRQLVLLQQKGLRASPHDAIKHNLHVILATGPVSPSLVKEAASRLQEIALKVQ